MATLHVLQTGSTTFEQQDRLDSAGGAPLTDEGKDAVGEVAQQLKAERIVAIYAGPGESERQTARLAGKALGLKVKRSQALGDVDYGMWQGLTTEEIRRRQPKRWRQWTEAPSHASPPGGESLAEAAERQRMALKDVIKREKGEPSLVVLRPVMLALLECVLAGESLDGVWQRMRQGAAWKRFELDGKNI